MAVLQALLTALLSGLVAGVASFALNEERDRLDLRLRKIEELATAAAEYSDFVTNLYQRWAFGLQRRTISKAEIISFSGSEADRRDALRTRLVILLRIWFPDGIATYNRFNQKYSNLISADTAMFGAYDKPDFMEKASEVHNAIMGMVEAKNEFVSDILNYGRTVAARPFILERIASKTSDIKRRLTPKRTGATPPAPR